MRTLGRRDAAAIDRAAMERLGIPRAVLMENAARAVADAAMRAADELPGPAAFVVLCGKGHNGGDGYAAARLLATAGRDVRVAELAEARGAPLASEPAANRAAALALGIPVLDAASPDAIPAGPLVAIDALFGTGFRGSSLPPEAARLLARVRDRRRAGAPVRVVAVDVVSGTDCDTGAVAEGALPADATVAFVLPKTGSVAMPGLLAAGRILVAPIGFPPRFAEEALGPPDAVWADAAWVAAHAPVRARDAHKGDFGKVVVCGGAPGMPGAIRLAAEAAGRSGAGRVWGVAPDSVVPACAAALPEVLWRALASDDPAEAGSALKSLLDGRDACALGPGLAVGPMAAALAEAALTARATPVLDAGALRALAAEPARLLPLLAARTAAGLAPAVLTPHADEFAALAAAAGLPPDPDATPLSAARALAARLGCVVLRKGHGTVVAAPDGYALLNSTGSDGLAKGGSGDLLSGLLAGFLAQGLPPAEAAACAAHLHGLAGELAEARLGARAMLPTDLLDELPEAYRRCGWSRRAAGPPEPAPKEGTP